MWRLASLLLILTAEFFFSLVRSLLTTLMFLKTTDGLLISWVYNCLKSLNFRFFKEYFFVSTFVVFSETFYLLSVFLKWNILRENASAGWDWVRLRPRTGNWKMNAGLNMNGRDRSLHHSCTIQTAIARLWSQELELCTEFRQYGKRCGCLKQHPQRQAKHLCFFYSAFIAVLSRGVL